MRRTTRLRREERSHAGDWLRLVDLDGAAAGHVEVRVALGEGERGVQVGGFDDAVASDLAGAGGGALGGDVDAVGERGAEVAMPSPTRPAHSIHWPMIASISEGSGGAASAGVVGAW